MVTRLRLIRLCLYRGGSGVAELATCGFGRGYQRRLAWCCLVHVRGLYFGALRPGHRLTGRRREVPNSTVLGVAPNKCSDLPPARVNGTKGQVNRRLEFHPLSTVSFSLCFPSPRISSSPLMSRVSIFIQPPPPLSPSSAPFLSTPPSRFHGRLVLWLPQIVHYASKAMPCHAGAVPGYGPPTILNVRCDTSHTQPCVCLLS